MATVDPYSYLKGFDPREYDCKPGESDEQCQKRLFEQRALVACKVCATIFTDGLALPACGALNPLISSIVWTMTGWLEKPIGKLLGWLFGGLSSLKASPVFSPAYEIDKLWKGSDDPMALPENGPVSKAWFKALESIQTAWDEIRKSKGLSPSPLRFSGVLVKKLADELWPRPAISQIVAETMPSSMSVDEALAYICYRDTTPQSGWGAGVMQNYGNGKGNVGYVYSGPNNKGAVLGVFYGQGPFAFTSIENWGSDCNETNCINAFRDDVFAVWAARLQCVARAMPAMVALTATQFEWQEQGLKGINTTENRREKESRAEYEKLSASKSIVIGTTVATAGTAVWYFWPQISNFVVGKLLSKVWK